MEHLDPTILLQNLTDVTAVFSYLGQRLEASAQALQTTGTPPNKSVITELMAAWQNFVEVRAQGHALAKSFAITPLPELESLTSLSEIKILLGKITLTEEEQKTTERVLHRAVTVLNRVCALRHRGMATFPPLAICQARATALREEIVLTEWPQVHPSAEAIAKEDDAFSALLTLVESRDELDDELCGAFQEVVSHEFDKPLAVAALRGNLIFSDTPAFPTLEPNVNGFGHTPRDQSDLPASGVVSERETSSDDAVSSIATVGEVAEHVSLTEETPPREATAPSTKDAPGIAFPLSDPHGHAVNDMPYASALAPSFLETALTSSEEHAPQGGTADPLLYRFAPAEQSQQIALLLLNGTNGTVEKKPFILRDLAWRLLFEKRLSLAFHVAQCVEKHYPEVHPQLPSWLLRAVVLGQRLRTPRGEIARMLKEDFVQHRPKEWGTENPEWNLAVGLLTSAAALVPALLAPETMAATFLRGLSLRKTMPYLAAYCEAVAAYSEKGVPFDPTPLKRVIRTHQPEVIGFVRVGQGKKEFRPEVVEALRHGLSQRVSLAMDELQRLHDSSFLVPVLGSIGACQRALDQVTALFDTETPFIADEPLPRPLLNADLSRIPSLVMNKSGEIEGAGKPSFADSIVRLVASGAARVL